jgi:hypothetical protein
MINGDQDLLTLRMERRYLRGAIHCFGRLRTPIHARRTDRLANQHNCKLERR